MEKPSLAVITLQAPLGHKVERNQHTYTLGLVIEIKLICVGIGHDQGTYRKSAVAVACRACV
jgi:ribosomal protein S27E